MARPTIAFLTDFGTRDHYVGAMKGAALTICPEATLVDITHDIDPQDILGGALELAASYAYFPPRSVFVAVVDPGVGSARRALAAEAGDYTFVAPDNGLLTLVLRDLAAPRVVELRDPQFARATVSRTFEGRDRFAPAAAWLARGTPVASLGPGVESWEVLEIPRAEVSGNTLRGEVLRIDRFGNLVTSIDRDAFDGFAAPGAVVLVGPHRIRLVTTYADAALHALCALFGSSNRLEIAVNGGSAARHLGVARGAPVAVSRA
jgi:S-adenosyl-L-methionine hydrolase (adenosine-forming)